MFCPKCGGIGKFDDFAETDLGEVPFYQCENCESWFYGNPRKTPTEYIFDGYKIAITNTGRRDKLGKAIIKYTFTAPDGEILFQGEDLHCSPMHAPESLETAKSLLTFLTLKPGDTDSDYFEDYTPRQMEWCQSMDCENLSLYAMEGDILP
jgi:hypothetical protein